MTSAVEYSYIGNGFSLRINESLINRAVRVKSGVKDKLKRIFERNASLENAEIAQANEPAQVVSAEQEDTLIDLSEEKMSDLNEKLNKLQLQSSVPFVVSRAVLFTKPLVAKIKGVTKKWFNDMPVIEEKIVSTGIPVAEENVVGVIPGTWDDVPEMNQNNLVSVGEQAVEEPTNDGMTISVSEETPVYEPQVEVSEPTVENETPAVEASSELEIPSFMPNMDELVPNSESVSETEFIPEPKSVDEESYVSEPTAIESEEPETPSIEVEEPTVIPTTEVESVVPMAEPQVEQEESHEEVSEYKMTIEEKIAQLIERKNKVHTEEVPEITAVSEQAPDEDADKKLETKPELTQAGILAKLQRLNNTMKDKDATIRNLTTKVESSREEIAQAKEKISGYEAVVNDLTVKNNSLSKENERLTQKVSEAETESQSTIARLEAQVGELTKSKTEEAEASKKAISDLKEKHAKEIADLKEKHASELKAVTDTKERQIQAIYATITDALGENPAEEDYGRSIAA